MEINGFKISKYNIHDFPDGKKNHTCPLCSHERKKKTQKCVTLFWDKGFAHCSHCGENIQLHEYEKKNKTETYKVPDWQNNTDLSDKVVKWFKSRGIDQFILRIMKITEGVEFMPGADKWVSKNTIQFPYYRNCQIVNIKYRSGDKNFKLYKDAEKIVYNLDNLYEQKEIYLVEGELDVLAVMQCGIHNVGSPPNGFTLKGNVNIDFINSDIDYFLNAEKLILAFDNDAPGENGKREFIRRFGAHKCYTVDLKDCKDANDYLIKYGSEKLKEALDNYTELPLENISNYEDTKQNVRNFFLNGMPKGLVTDTIKGLDTNFSVNTGQIVLVTGIPSSGKSEIVDQIVISYAVKYGHKTGFASVENKPNELHHQKIIRKLVGKTPKSIKDFDDPFEACERFSSEHFYMIDLENGYDLERVLIKAEELVYRKGIRCLVIDPFNKVRFKGNVESITGNRTNDYTNTYLELLNNFAVKFDILIILVAHPVKMNKLDTGKRAIPDFYDVKGGGEFYDMCHHGLVVHRDYDMEMTLIRTLKVKFLHLGSSNEDSYFKYNINNGRLNDINGNIKEFDTISVDWDNANWVTKELKEVEQTQLYNNVDENEDFYWNKESGEVPF